MNCPFERSTCMLVVLLLMLTGCGMGDEHVSIKRIAPLDGRHTGLRYILTAFLRM